MATEDVKETSLDERRNQQAPKGFESPDLNEWGELHRAAAPRASTADFVAFRLVELRTKSMAGGFDVEHLQATTGMFIRMYLTGPAS